MSLWSPLGTKPKFLTDAEKKLVYATASGWVLEAGAESARLTGNDNPNAQPEVLVAIGDLADRMSSATITDIEFVTTALGAGAGGLLEMRVRFDEEVTVTGSPRFLVTNDTPARNQTLTHHSGSGTNELIFRKTVAGGGLTSGDVLSVGTNAVSQHSGSTIKDKGTTTDADIANVAAIGTAAGTLTVAA